MVIYYLEKIKRNIKNDEESTKQEGIIPTDNEMSKKAEEVMQEKENTYMFIKQLNASSSTVGFIILIASYQAADCAVFLLGNDTTYFQGGAIALRLTLWGFLAVFPFHKAAGVNIAIRRLHDLAWDIHVPPLGGPYGSNESKCITLKAKVFGISVNPWLPYMVTIIILLTIMIGSKFKWYEHVL